MTTDSDMFLTPRPKSTSLLQVGFNASPQLNDALHRFLLPETRPRPIALRAEQSRTLAYGESDHGGVRYRPEDAAKLADDARRFHRFGGLVIAIDQLELRQSRAGDIQIRLGLNVTPHMQRLLGGFVLGSAGDLADAPPWVYAQLSHSRLRAQPDIISAAKNLRDSILGPARENSREGIYASPIYVTEPHIIERVSG